MTDRDHDEIARRLRDTGTVPAPDRLRGEVMSQVRAEPRARERRPRPSFLVPVLPYAAAAAALTVVVLAFSHLSGGGSGSSAGGAGASGGGAAIRSPEASGALGGHTADQAISAFRLTPIDARRFAALPGVTATKSPKAITIAVPRSRYSDYRKRLAKVERRTPEGPTIRVILKPAP